MRLFLIIGDENVETCIKFNLYINFFQANDSTHFYTVDQNTRSISFFQINTNGSNYIFRIKIISYSMKQLKIKMKYLFNRKYTFKFQVFLGVVVLPLVTVGLFCVHYEINKNLLRDRRALRSELDKSKTRNAEMSVQIWLLNHTKYLFYYILSKTHT